MSLEVKLKLRYWKLFGVVSKVQRGGVGSHCIQFRDDVQSRVGTLVHDRGEALRRRSRDNRSIQTPLLCTNSENWESFWPNKITAVVYWAGQRKT